MSQNQNRHTGGRPLRVLGLAMVATVAAAGGVNAELEPEATSAEQKLTGTWEANDVDAKLGEVRIKLTFKEDGPVKIAAWSEIPLVGQVREMSGPYSISGNIIRSKAIREGTEVKFHFRDDGRLVIEYKEGKQVVFRRV